MVQKYTFQICQKLAIAAALAATLSCLPVVAQTNQANETLILNDKPVTFSEFLKTYPDNDARAKALSPLPRETKRAFRDWEMAQLNKRRAEQDAEMARLDKRRAEQDKEMEQLEKRLAEKKIALKLFTELNTILDELVKEQGASKPIMPEQQAINKNRATIIIAALSNPMVTSGLSSQALSILKMTSDNLQKGGNLSQLNIDLVKNVRILSNK